MTPEKLCRLIWLHPLQPNRPRWLVPKSQYSRFTDGLLLIVLFTFLPTMTKAEDQDRGSIHNSSQQSPDKMISKEPSEMHPVVEDPGMSVVLSASALSTTGLSPSGSNIKETEDINSVLSGKLENRRKTYINLEQYMRNLTRQPGARAMFYCDILGQPIPQFQWLKDGKLLTEQPNRIRIETGLWGSSLRVEKIDQSDEGMYVCVARNPSGNVNATAYLWVVEKSKTSTNSKTQVEDENMFNPRNSPEMDGFCQEFHSNVCGKYLFGHRVFVTREFQQALIESQISKFLKLTATQPLHRIREDCLRNMMEAMCYYNFPVCLPVATTGVNTDNTAANPEVEYRAHYLCRQDCYMIKQNECSATYKYLERTMLQELPSMIMNCARLPLYTAEHPTACRRIGQPLPVLVQDTVPAAGGPEELMPVSDRVYWKNLVNEKADTSSSHMNPNEKGALKQKSGTNHQADITGSMTNGPDLVPLFVSVGVMFIVGFMLLAVCFLCRRNWDRSPRLQTDGSSLLSRARGSGSRFGRFNGGGPCSGSRNGNGSGSVGVRGQGVGAAMDNGTNKKRRVPGMGSGVKGTKNGRLLSNVDDGYMIAYTPGSNNIFGQSDSSNNLNGASTNNGPHSLSSGHNSQVADPNSLHLKTGSMPTYHQYQPTNYGSSSVGAGPSAAGVPLPLPPPNAPAPPPPNPLSMGPLSPGTGTTTLPHTSVGTNAVHMVTAHGNNSAEFHIDMGIPYEANVVSADSPTAYTTLRNSSPNGYLMNGPQVPFSVKDDLPTRATEYPISQLRFGKQFGQGVFGPVYKAELLPNTTYENGHPISVIVKTLSAGSPASLQADFRRESDLIAELDHPNLLSLLGVSLQHPPWCMIFEVRQYVDLCELLASRRTTNSPDSNLSPLLETEKLHVVAQVAAGMDYLSSHRFVHRDLAARNVLILNDQLFCKITDLGLARDCYANDYYRLHPHSLMLPIRWMPLDSIIYGKFTVESDIWAYGVLMWEVWSGGMRPYANYSDSDVLDLIRARKLLSKPTSCSTKVYAFMNGCWHDEPERRPTFQDCLHQISQWQCELALTGGHTNCEALTYSSPSDSTVSHSGRAGEGPPVMGLSSENNIKNADRHLISNGYSPVDCTVANTGNSEQFSHHTSAWCDQYSVDADCHAVNYSAGVDDTFPPGVTHMSPDGSSANGKLQSLSHLPAFNGMCPVTRYDNQTTNSALGMRLLPNTTTMCIPATDPVI
ncbi:Receptor protein-tyrosine kinase [Fasciola gigantica]|uniref:Receptor protein-tyrosine kinase n=1 Tax=Fasciola gigantica TaxID=46835 RepID=A0A504Y798_FASGI|nr:Receptor protein-tyrosine kinase [Fasciola gigantica]